MKDRDGVAWWPWLVAGLLLAATILALVLWGPAAHAFVADRDRVRGWVEGFGGWAPAIIFGLELAQVLLAPIPGQAIEAVSGYLFGPWRCAWPAAMRSPGWTTWPDGEAASFSF